MKATCNREGLLTAFQTVSSVVPQRSPKQILRNVKFDLSADGQATLSATDLDLGIRYRVSGVSAEQPGTVVLPTSEVVAILRELPDESVQLVQTESGVKLSGASSRFELPSEDPLQFPEIPDFGDEEGHRIRSGDFATMIRRTIFAIASENSRYALHSVRIDFEPERAILVATDGKRLAVMPGQAKVSGNPPQGTFLIPPKALQLLQKVLQDPEEELHVLLRENEVLFRNQKVTIYSRLTEGRFPRYQEVFPPEAKHVIPLPVAPFHAVVRQSKIVTSDESRGVDFSFRAGELTLESRSAEVGRSEVKLPIGYDGNDIEVTFDPQLLIDALKVLDPSEEIRLHLIDGVKATVIRTGDGYAYVVMPLTRESDRS
jgi:DNA polymerase-3 subunit beta